MALQYTLVQLLKAVIDQNGSDLHITAFSPPRIRVDGALIPLQVGPLSPEDAKHLCYSVLTEYQRERFEKNKELDFSFSVENFARFRGNVFMQQGHVSAAFRMIPTEIKTIDQLGLPPIFKRICHESRGLVLVTGPTGSGKSTTLAAMIDYINHTRKDHIVTIEDPVEFIHHHKNCIVNQREIGFDSYSFANALKSILRQDPDVVLIGEMRDLETISAALTTAETGHLVFATLHTNGCVQTLNRIIDVFPANQQDQIRTQLAMTVKAVISQTLVPKIQGGRALALEIMVSNPAIRALIIEGKFNQIYSYMQSGQESSHMQTMNQALSSLVFQKQISPETALEKTPDFEELQKILLQGPRKRTA